MLTADRSNEIDRLRAEQRRAAADARQAATEREREYCMLGVNDYLIEELIVLYWKEAISNQLSAVSQDAKLNAES
jgi:hypothetical protein